MNWPWFTIRSLFRPALAGSAAAFALATLMTGIDWWKNPAGIFHDRTGTDWTITGETFFSWFWPALPAIVILFLFVRLVRRQRIQPRDDRK